MLYLLIEHGHLKLINYNIMTRFYKAQRTKVTLPCGQCGENVDRTNTYRPVTCWNCKQERKKERYYERKLSTNNAQVIHS